MCKSMHFRLILRLLMERDHFVYFVLFCFVLCFVFFYLSAFYSFFLWGLAGPLTFFGIFWGLWCISRFGSSHTNSSQALNESTQPGLNRADGIQYLKFNGSNSFHLVLWLNFRWVVNIANSEYGIFTHKYYWVWIYPTTVRCAMVVETTSIEVVNKSQKTWDWLETKREHCVVNEKLV